MSNCNNTQPKNKEQKKKATQQLFGNQTQDGRSLQHNQLNSQNEIPANNSYKRKADQDVEELEG